MPNKSSFKTHEDYLAWYQNYRDNNRLSVRANSRKHNRLWRLKNGRNFHYPEKQQAREILYKQMRRGLIKREPCKVCKYLPSEAHHEDYNKPLEVVWLCRKHHAFIHRKYK